MKKIQLRFLFAFILFAALLFAGRAVQSTPGLVVVMVIDQARADYLDRFESDFGDSGFRRFLKHGAVYTEARFRHAVTFTGPGHASVSTGVDPREHGIVANHWFDRLQNQPVYCVDDPSVHEVGSDPTDPHKKSYSPENMLSPTVGDRLKGKWKDSRVVSISLKERSAILLGGKKADFVSWFDEKENRFVSSSYYPPHPEGFLFNQNVAQIIKAHPTWNLTKKISDPAVFDPPGLFQYKGFPPEMRATFPHPLTTTRAFLDSPFGNDLLFDYANDLVDRFHLGANSSGHPDMLFIALSSLDYCGHMFGPDSKEVAEFVLDLDQSLESFMKHFRSNSTVFFITADHGVTPIPEVTQAKSSQKDVAGRMNLEAAGGKISDGSLLRTSLEKFLAEKFHYPLDLNRSFAEQGAVLCFYEPYLYLNRTVLSKRGIALSAAQRAIKDWLMQQPGIQEVFTRDEITHGFDHPDIFGRMVARSFQPERSGDLHVLLKPKWIFNDGNTGTTHGQAQEDDTHVMLLALGPGIVPGRYQKPVTPLSIAKTIAALYGFQAGANDVQPLNHH